MMIAIIQLASRLPSKPIRDLADRRSVGQKPSALAPAELPSARPDVVATAPSRPARRVCPQTLARKLSAGYG